MKKAYINFKESKIYGRSGTVYNIQPEMLSTGRAPEYEIRTATLGFVSDFKSIYTAINDAINILMRGKDNAQGNAHVAINKLQAITERLTKLQDVKRSSMVEFCSLFCIGPNEDVSTHDEETIRAKWEDWAEIPEKDFFLLATSVIDGYRDIYLEVANNQQGVNKTKAI